jgi:hypothetical protein
MDISWVSIPVLDNQKCIQKSLDRTCSGLVFFLCEPRIGTDRNPETSRATIVCMLVSPCWDMSSTRSRGRGWGSSLGEGESSQKASGGGGVGYGSTSGRRQSTLDPSFPLHTLTYTGSIGFSSFGIPLSPPLPYRLSHIPDTRHVPSFPPLFQ